MSAVPISPYVAATPWQVQFLAVLPAVKTHAQICFRYMPAWQREEATQEAIASACVAFQLLASRGKLHAVTPGSIAAFAVKHVRNGRHVGGRQDAATDVLSPAAQRRHDLKVMSYHGPSAGSEDWQQMTGAHRRASIPDLAAFRLDFAQWLKMQDSRDQHIVAALVSGDTTNGVAQQFGLTAGRVSQLRRRYEHSWQVFQGELPAKAHAG